MQRHFWGFLALCFAAVPSFAAITGVLMTPDGQPISGARVSIRTYETVDAARVRALAATPEAAPLSSAQTDSKGTFSLESPKDATVDLTVFARGYEPLVRRVERDEEVGAIALQKAEMRKGSVTAGGKPVSGALVLLYFGGYEYQTKTDAEGRYEAPDPKRASSLAIIHPDYAVNEERFSPLNTISPSVLQRALVAGSAFQGNVVSDDKNTPVAKATILVDGWPLATTGDDGKFAITHMPAKWKTILARKDTLLGQRAAGKEKSATIRVDKAATISGRIADAKSRVPVPGTVVRIGPRRMGPMSDGGYSVSALTDAKGAYSLVAPAGTYMVMASHPAYATTPNDASALAGQQTSKDIALAPMARVSGVVQDESKKPVVAATINGENAEGGGMGIPRRMMTFGVESAVSGPDGRFSMRVSPDQSLYIRAAKRGMPPAKSDSMQLAAGERKSGLVLVMPSGIAVGGRAIDAQGDPLSGVSVTAAEAEGGPRGMMMRMVIGGPSADEEAVTTASDGTFTMRVKEGTYDFTFRREGLAPKIVRGQNVTVTSSPNVEATMEPAAEISGRVLRGGMPLENVMVMAMVMGGSPSSATTAADGSFTLTGLAAGTVRLMARKEEDFVQEMRNVTAPARDVIIDVKAGGRITGRVVEKDSNKPITTFQAGITTSRGGGSMVMLGPPQLRSFTSEDGTFTLEGVPPGATVLMASAPGYSSARLNVNVEEGKDLTGVELQLDAGVKLTGRVTGSNGSPLSDVQVRVLPSTTGGFVTSGMDRTSTTDANGEYSIEALEPGDESISFTHAKHASTQKSVTLKGRETRLDVQLTAGGRVTGSVVTESGAPVGDAMVRASSSGNYETARTDANGAFEFDSVTPGRYRFSAEKTGFAEGLLEDVDVSNGAPVRIVLKTGGTIYGRVLGLTPKELGETEVTADAGQTYKQGTVDASGNYRIEGVPAGTVRVQASAGSMMTGSSRRAAMQSVDLAPGGSQQLDITFNSDVVIRGRVTRNGTPLSSATVSFFPRGNSQRSGGSAPTDNDGMYSISGLDEGEYSVMVNDMQRMSPHSTTYQVRGSSTFDIEYQTNALRGRVLDVSTNEPLASVTVSIRNSAQSEGPRMTRSALTDATGAFIFDSISAGSYTVTATKDGYGNETKDLYAGESAPQDLELHLARNVGITLTVVDARDGRPLTARATAYDMQGRVADESRMTFGGGSSSGNVGLNVAPGTYMVAVSAGGYASQNVSVQSPSQRTIALSPGGTLQVRSKHNALARIRLIDANGIPYWRISNANPSRELLPSPGTTTFPNIAADTYTLQLVEGDVVIDSKQIVVREGQTVQEEI